MGVEDGTYQLLRARLADRSAELGRRTAELNSRRQKVFGARELELSGSERLRTAGEARPCGLVAVTDEVLLLGTSAPGPEQGMLSLHRLDGGPGAEVPGLLDAPRFQHDLAELLRYYRDARLADLVRTPAGLLLAVFRTGTGGGAAEGRAPEDIRVLRWQLSGDRWEYLDGHGERDLPRHPPFELDWTPTGREQHRQGRIVIDLPGDTGSGTGGAVSVATTGGMLTVAAADGRTLFEEPVAEPLQSLADATVDHASPAPLLVLRIRPYKEPEDRYLVVNTRTGSVRRHDSLAQGARLLPAEQGLIFPDGCELADGTHRSFRAEAGAMRFDAVVHSPNGEDLLYVLRSPGRARVLLLPWNTVRREAGAPLHGAAHTLLPDGTLVLLKPGREAVRSHDVQLWHTPFTSAEYAAAQPVGEGPLARIGNADLVRGIADCLDAVRSGAADDTDPAVVVDACAKAADRHHWLAATGLLEPLAELRAAAELLGAERERVAALAVRAAEALDQAREQTAALLRRAQGEPPTDADAWALLLDGLRRAQGRTRLLRELPQLDLEALAEVEQRLAAGLTAATGRALAFLAGPDAFTAPLAAAEAAAVEAAATGTAAEAAELAARLTAQAEALTTVGDLVTGAQLGDGQSDNGGAPGEGDGADATTGTAVLLALGEVLAAVNRARAVLDARRRSLLDEEHRAAHAAESALLAQATTAGLAAADTPAGCDEQLARLLLRLDGLDARFAEAEDLAERLAARREEIQQAFAVRRQSLLDEAAARAARTAASAGRALEALRRRLAALPAAEDVHTCLATDPMAVRVRSAAAELRELGDPVRAQELDDGLTAAGRLAARALRDRAELSADGGATVRLGRHRFAVHREPVELALLPDGDGLVYAVTGTGYRRPATDPALLAGREFWTQTLVSEDPGLCRAEYLATGLLDATSPSFSGTDGEAIGAELLELVRRAAETAYDEGYERGVHDQDAALILGALRRLRAGAGLLRHPAPQRATAQLFWAHGASETARSAWQLRARSLTAARAAFGPGSAPTPADVPAPLTVPAALTDLAAELTDAIDAFARATGLPPAPDVGTYLAEELAAAPEGFACGSAARQLLDGLRHAAGPRPEEDLRQLGDDLAARHQLATGWLDSYADATGLPAADRAARPEAVALLCAADLPRYPVDAPLSETVDGLLGRHPRIQDRRLTVRIDELPYRAAAFRRQRVPAHRAFQRQRAELLTAERNRLRLEEYRPRPLSGFVRNQLIDEVYLPLVGDNLARQLGAADSASADRSGLLLLLSPPGYGKTTLLEYVADRLGLLMVRVDGPALGTGTTSLDPDRAPDAAARREVEKIVFALEAGSNVLLHLDDIQHLSPELLEKFIPLCDSQRRIEAVSDGRARSFDLRGRRFAVCLAGNPYTASGRRFTIPDMLANRADVWNLGEVLSGRGELFAQSFLENALAANPVLAPLAGGDPAELRLLIRLGSGDPAARADQLGRAVPDLDRVLATLTRLSTVQRTVLAVNRAYTASAAQDDATRTEPPFLLQGSYRTMNALAARIDPLLDERELEALLDDHYRAEAQTLGNAAEANLLRLAQLRGRATAEQTARWEQVRTGYPAG
ncbi:DNA repair ATPase [Streptacidiphilus albus]|uniref:DNA repair ATPase n=1 Tax=Streptacidiphilus albus TaxID=105425 RepID=UPI00068C25A6|nr:DNA repair ATPase [Streptacidiphilus albus]